MKKIVLSWTDGHAAENIKTADVVDALGVSCFLLNGSGCPCEIGASQNTARATAKPVALTPLSPLNYD